MANPTPTQRAVMQAMRDGAVLHEAATIPAYLSGWRLRGQHRTVRESTFKVLWDRAWIRRDGTGRIVCTLTPKGLAALEDKPDA